MGNIDRTILDEKMTAEQPDHKLCVHEFGIRAFKVSADEFGDGNADDFYGLAMRVVGHDDDKTVSVDLLFDEDASRKLLLLVTEQTNVLVDNKYGHMTPDEMTDALADKLADQLMTMLGITVPDDQKGN